MSVDAGIDNNLDAVFAEVGEFGVFQIISLILICIPNTLFGSYVVSYIFASYTLGYRCKVPECDVGENNRDIVYDQPWLKFAIPTSKNGFENCVRNAPINSTTTNDYQCSANLFNTSKQIPCKEFVYKTDEINIQTEFNIHCGDSYKLALIGSANSLGRFIFLPITGFLSDRFGRLKVVVIGMLTCSVFGIIKSFSLSYWMYMIFEFFEASAGTCTFSGIYVLGLECLSSKYRALVTTLIVTSFPIGEILLGVGAMHIHNLWHLLRVIYVPGLLVIFYFWLVPESLRWLLITGRVERAIKTFKRIASVNGKTLSDKSIDMLRSQYSTTAVKTNANAEKEVQLSILQQVLQVFESRKLGLRLLNLCYQWITCCFCYYGMSLISTHIPADNRYMSYILVQAVEIPGAMLPALVLNRFGRRKLMFTALALCGTATLLTQCMSEKSMLTLLLFMIGKASITFSFNVLYIFTAEMWPTNLRQTILNSCSMIGRLGATVAPLTTLLIAKTPFLPFLLFGCAALFAALLILLCPETYEKKLPDSVEEAKGL